MIFFSNKPIHLFVFLCASKGAGGDHRSHYQHHQQQHQGQHQHYQRPGRNSAQHSASFCFSLFLFALLFCWMCVCVCVFAHLSCRKKKITPSDLLVWVFLRVLGSWRNQNGRRLAIDGFFYWWWTGSHWQVLSDDDVSDQRNRSHSIAFR